MSGAAAAGRAIHGDVSGSRGSWPWTTARQTRSGGQGERGGWQTETGEGHEQVRGPPKPRTSGDDAGSASALATSVDAASTAQGSPARPRRLRCRREVVGDGGRGSSRKKRT